MPTINDMLNTIRFYCLFLIVTLFYPSSASSQLKDEEAYVVIHAFMTAFKEPYILQTDLRSFKPRVSMENDVLNRKMYDHNPYMDVLIDSLLTKEDFTYMQSCLSGLQKMTHLDTMLLKKYHISTSTKKENKAWKSIRLTIPLFTQKGNVALIYMEHDRGSGVGGGSVVFMKRQKNGNWKVVSSVPAWIS